MTEAAAKIPRWLPEREAVARGAHHLNCTPEAAELQIIGKAAAGWIRACGLTAEGWWASSLPAAWRGARSIPDGTMLRLEDLTAANLLSGRPEGQKWWWASQVLAWFSWREPWELESGEWPTEMGPEIVAAQLELSEKIAAGRIRLWGRRPGSAEFKQISNDLFSLSKYKVVVTPHGDLSTEPPRKRPEFEAEYEDDCKWHDIKFDEDEIRAERRPAGRAGLAPEPLPLLAPYQGRPHLRLVSGARSGETEAPAQPPAAPTSDPGAGSEESPPTTGSAVPAAKRRKRRQTVRPKIKAVIQALYPDGTPDELTDKELQTAVTKRMWVDTLKRLYPDGAPPHLNPCELDAAVKAQMKADSMSWPPSLETIRRASDRRIDKPRRRSKPASPPHSE